MDLEVNSKGGTFEVPEAKTSLARLCSFVELGLVVTPFFEEEEVEVNGVKVKKPKLDSQGNRIPKKSRQGMLTFEIYQKDKVYYVSAWLTLSTSEKARLRTCIEALLDRKLIDGEKLEMEDLIGKACQVGIEVKEKDGKKRAQITNYLPILEGITIPEMKAQPRFLSYKKWNEDVFQKLGDKIKDTMRATTEYRHKDDPKPEPKIEKPMDINTTTTGYNMDGSVADEDIPF